MKKADADNWVEFFEDTAGGVDTFTMNLTRYYEDASLTSVTMRLASNDVSWSVNQMMLFGITFVAEEVV